jgi:hypothetical protein
MFRRARVPFLAVATLVAFAACSDSTAPKSASAPTSADAARSSGSPAGSNEGLVQDQAQQGAPQEIEVSVRKGSALGLQKEVTAQHAFVCNFLGTECIQILENYNYVYRVHSEGRATGFGCSRVYFFVNGRLAVYSRGAICHGPGDVLVANWLPRRYFRFGSVFCSDWRGARTSPPGYVCQRF